MIATVSDAVRIVAVVLVVVATFCARPGNNSAPAHDIATSLASPAMAGVDLLAVAAIDIADDGADIHQAMRGHAGSLDPLGARPPARRHAEPIALIGLWPPERPPRIA